MSLTQLPPPSSSGSAVSSVFGRTGAVVAAPGDYTAAQVTGAAPLDSPALTGTPTAPTAAVGTNTTQVATTAFVLANGAAPVYDKVHIWAGTAQAIPTTTFTKVNIDTVIFDTNSIANTTTYQIVPKKAGYYSIAYNATADTSSSNALAVAYKNGVAIFRGWQGTGYGGAGAGLVYMNGTTDYLELYMYTEIAANTSINPDTNYFTAIGPL